MLLQEEEVVVAAVLPFLQAEAEAEEQVVRYPFHLVLGMAAVVVVAEVQVRRCLAAAREVQMVVVPHFFVA